MKILTDEAEDKLVSIIGTAIVVSIALLFIGLVGWIEVGMYFNPRTHEECDRIRKRPLQ